MFRRPAILDVVILPIHPWLDAPWLPATVMTATEGIVSSFAGVIVALVGFI
jgi:hypothetical protein